MQQDSVAKTKPAIAVFEHLTGPAQGAASWAGEEELHVTLGSDNLLNVSAEKPLDERAILVARLQRTNDSYTLHAADDQQMWVNGLPVQSRQLKHHDVIEFTDVGPISRVYLYNHSQSPQVSAVDILSDARAYMRVSRRPFPQRLANTLGQVGRRLARQTTMLFRAGVIVTLIVLCLIAFQQYRINVLVGEKIEAGANRLESISQLLAEVRKEALVPGDLTKLREELTGPIASAQERLKKLERRTTAVSRVIAQARSSIIFLQGSYAFRENSTGQMLRHVLGPGGAIIVLPNGVPMLSLKGTGPVAVRHFIGSGFLLGNKGIIATSRHIGQPWSDDANLKALLGKGLEAVMKRFIAYLPDAVKPVEVSLIGVSKVADVAILRMIETSSDLGGLALSDRPPKPGEEVTLMGYPTGIRSMLAQAGPDFVAKLQEEKVTDFWKIVERLALARRIEPLASHGIIGRVSEQAIVYDAETTHGGSGGPVLDVDGRVVAINSAILPEYGGSNLGVPANELRRLMSEIVPADKKDD